MSQQIVDEGLGYKGQVGLEYLLSQYNAGNITLEKMETEARKMEERNTDWFDILYRNAYSQTYNLSFPAVRTRRIIIFPFPAMTKRGRIK